MKKTILIIRFILIFFFFRNGSCGDLFSDDQEPNEEYSQIKSFLRSIPRMLFSQNEDSFSHFSISFQPSSKIFPDPTNITYIEGVVSTSLPFLSISLISLISLLIFFISSFFCCLCCCCSKTTPSHSVDDDDVLDSDNIRPSGVGKPVVECNCKSCKSKMYRSPDDFGDNGCCSLRGKGFFCLSCHRICERLFICFFGLVIIITAALAGVQVLRAHEILLNTSNSVVETYSGMTKDIDSIDDTLADLNTYINLSACCSDGLDIVVGDQVHEIRIEADEALNETLAIQSLVENKMSTGESIIASAFAVVCFTSLLAMFLAFCCPRMFSLIAIGLFIFTISLVFLLGGLSFPVSVFLADFCPVGDEYIGERLATVTGTVWVQYYMNCQGADPFTNVTDYANEMLQKMLDYKNKTGDNPILDHMIEDVQILIADLVDLSNCTRTMTHWDEAKDLVCNRTFLCVLVNVGASVLAGIEAFFVVAMLTIFRCWRRSTKKKIAEETVPLLSVDHDGGDC